MLVVMLMLALVAGAGMSYDTMAHGTWSMMHNTFFF
jgi:hypothetical protein